MGYTTKEFCEICNVGRETLRHYEQLGFLRPEINPANHYRSYDGWDASVIAGIKRYQSLGFSLEQIKGMLFEYDLAELRASVEDRMTIYHEQIRYYQMLCKKSKEELALFACIPQLSGRYTVSQMPSLIYIPDKELCHVPSAGHAVKHFDFFMPCICADADFADDETKPDHPGWGLLAKKEYSDYFEIQNGIIIPASKAVCTVIDTGEDGNITKMLFDSFCSYVRQSELDSDSAIYACLFARTHDRTGGCHQYLFAFCPMQDGRPD